MGLAFKRLCDSATKTQKNTQGSRNRRLTTTLLLCDFCGLDLITLSVIVISRRLGSLNTPKNRKFLVELTILEHFVL